MSRIKIAFLDIEASNLHADFGHTISFAGKHWGSPKVFKKTILDYAQDGLLDDRGLLMATRDWLADADVWVSWYGSRFDIPFLNSRLIMWGEHPLPPVPHVDLWKVSRYKLHIHSNRLESAAMFLGANSKTRLDGNIWTNAAVGDPKSVRYVLHHNVEDVYTLERVYRKLRSLVPTHPNVTLAGGDPETQCWVCGSSKIQRRGHTLCQTRKYPRIACLDCGSWRRGRAE